MTMRAAICHLLIFAVLFVSIEGAGDLVVDGVPHGDEVSHQDEFGHSLGAHDGTVPDTDLDGAHCEHCCHGHTANLIGSMTPLAMQTPARNDQFPPNTDVRNLAQAPPTPPPNA